MTRSNPIVVGPFPEPRHGMAVVTEAAADVLDQSVRIDTSAGGLSGRAVDKLAKLARLVGGALSLLRRARSAPVVLLAADSGEGMYATAAMVGIARLSGTPVVLHHHTEAYLHHPRPTMAVIQRIGGRRLVNALLCPGTARRFRQTYDLADDRVAVLGNAFSVPVSPVLDRPTRPVTVGHLANLSKAKGVTDVVRLARSLPDVPFVVAGPVVDEVAADAVAILAELPNVELLGPLDAEGVARFHQSCDVFVLPSESEAMPLVVWEALAAGAMVASYDVGCVRSMADDDESIRVADSPADLDRLLNDVVVELNQRDAAGWDKGRSAVRAVFTDRRTADRKRLVELLAQVGRG